MKASVIAVVAGLSILGANVYAADTQTNTTSILDQADRSDGASNQKEGTAFLTDNAKKTGVVSLQDGLQYKILTDGTGPQPTDSDVVKVDYEGTLVNGTVFDSSYKRGEAATFPVNAVIPGWTEALKLMKVGSTWMLYIPSTLAYGSEGASPAIGPNETLIFKVHLIGIEKGVTAQQ